MKKKIKPKAIIVFDGFTLEITKKNNQVYYAGIPIDIWESDGILYIEITEWLQGMMKRIKTPKL